MSGPTPPLRVGLLVDSLTQPAWISRALQRIRENGAGELVLVVRNAASGTQVRRSRVQSWWKNRQKLLYALYQRLDNRGASGPDPFAPTDIGPLLADVPVIDAVPRQVRAVDFIEDKDLERIRAANLDVLIRFGFRILKGGILTAAKHGVWSYHHGDNQRYRGGPPCFWEVIEGEPVTGTILQRLTESLDDGEVLYRSWGATNLLSVSRGRSEVYWKSAEFIARAMRRVQENGSVDKGVSNPSSYGHQLYTTPSNKGMATGMVKVAARRVRERIRDMASVDQWFLAFRRRDNVPDENREPDLSPFRFQPIVPPKDRFWADPFPLRVGNADYVLFEDYPYDTGKGVISALEIGPSGPVGQSQVVLSRDHHLSYPFVFSWLGSLFMIPESALAGKVEMYRAVKAPYEWTLESVVWQGSPLADCTLVEIGGRWWMFANSAAEGASFWDELHLFHAPSPLGPWIPHRLNPVVTDVRTARPAGGLFRRGDSWFRPSQDCSRGYGGALNIQKILKLDEHTYEEETVGRLLPDWQPGLTGVHTVNAIGGLTMIDARKRVGKVRGR